MDWGTLISDFKGTLHDASKNAFDSLTKNSRRPLNATDSILRQSIGKTYQQFKNRLAGEFNIDRTEDLTIENLSSKIGAQMKNTAIRVGTETTIALLGQSVSAIEGPLGLLLSELASVAIGEFSHYVAGKHSYKPGQWVFLDVGRQTRKINENPKVIELSQADVGLWMGDSNEYAIIPDDLD